MSLDDLNWLVSNTEPRATKMIQHLRAEGIAHEELLALMGNLPRHKFVEPAFSHLAYSATPLPIGRNQTISQPLTVARMTQWLLLYARLGRVLEVGTGSGYQTRILSHFFNKVHTVERQQWLHLQAKQRLSSMGVKNVEYLFADGQTGWPHKVEMDAVIITAMASKIPLALTRCLKPQGILIMPIDHPSPQIGCWRKEGDRWKRLGTEAAFFVPLLEGMEHA
ncbi:protein-L-isoaspartate(D-aspartate) O-methyltransferase [Marinomonas sp. M1K-6]|uniref:Protein-L-isoaspartate O-methyltransferase n=1 Tax=Marinomonas profundi TaxID=2726122 RepID=A0A847R2S4_9GAMM|nr:protein-L-isoaspartate(D-aspartate) O-methyltransferase [Marinomonas profundi]NLQ18181.1 protein-L-isoaspartate(D-aspartate) O-methyltransferase [Marinomonas profundi]UDV03536.1 protein-L-isoaspartate(D-aspartate) O-methyltransferase [Marinomonas profundi]